MKSGKTNGAEGAALVVSSFLGVGVGVGVGADIWQTFGTGLAESLFFLFNALAMPPADDLAAKRET